MIDIETANWVAFERSAGIRITGSISDPPQSLLFCRLHLWFKANVSQRRRIAALSTGLPVSQLDVIDALIPTNCTVYNWSFPL